MAVGICSILLFLEGLIRFRATVTTVGVQGRQVCALLQTWQGLRPEPGVIHVVGRYLNLGDQIAIIVRVAGFG